MNRALRLLGLTLLAAASAGLLTTLLVRDQVSRHRRNLFHSMAFRRLAALGHMARAEASVDNINLLRDFISWESRSMLRGRAQAIVRRMEDEAQGSGPGPLGLEA
ncbi:MAG: hypothetical protein WEA09_02115 [Gemmatimonadota bacterium]